MKKATARLVTVGFVLLGLLFVLTAEAQMGGSSRDRSARPMGPQGYGSKGQQEQQQQEDRQVQPSPWLQGDEQQQEQLLGCFRLSSTLTLHSRDIRKMMTESPVNWKEVISQFEDLQRGAALLSEKHELFALELNNGQRTSWERFLREIMSLQLQLSERMGAIDRGIRGEKPESVPMVKAFIDLEGQFRKWQDYYGQIGADMNMPDLEQRMAPGKIRGLPGAQNPGR